MAGTAGTYELGRFTGTCAGSGVAIASGTAFVAALVDRLNEEGIPTLTRLDYSVDAWNTTPRPQGLVSFWKSTAPEPGERRQMFVDDETLLDMVERMEGDDDSRRRSFRWVLALALLRKRTLRLEGIEHTESGESWVFRRRGAEEGASPIRIPNPGIKDDELKELAEQLSDVIRPDGG